MTRSLLRWTALAVLVASAAHAQNPPPPPGSLDTWVEACEAEEAGADLQALLAHEALIMPIEGIVQNLNGTFSIVSQPFSETQSGTTICSNSRFYGETQVADTPFRSAVQVGPDLVLTAWHSAFAPGLLGSYVVVTGLRSRMVGDTCVPASFDGIAASQLFELTEVVADGEPTPTSGIDFLVLRVDRPISATYPRVRRSGYGHPGDSVTVVGHPERMSAKVDIAGTAGRLKPYGVYEGLEVANVHLLQSSSGGMLYNRTQRLVETVAQQGGNATFFPIDPTIPGCRVIGHVDRWSQLHASLVHFAENIPAFELIVDDLDPVVNVTTVGGGLPHPTTSRTVGTPSTAAGPIAYQIVPPPPFTPGQPTLTITPGAPLSGTLAPNTAFTIGEQAHIHGVACGRYERSYVVRDLTHGFDDVARHQFEISLREFTVVPASSRVLTDIALPLEQTISYTIHNPREEPVTVEVTANQAWTLVRVPGGPGPAPSIQVPLAPGASAQVVVDVVGPLEPETYPQPYHATITFDFADGTICPAFADPVTREFTLIYGAEDFPGPAALPIPEVGGPLPLSLPISEAFCVGDLNVRIDTTGVPASHIFAKLAGPLSLPLPITLWNQGSLPSSRPLRGTLDDEGPIELRPVQPLSTFDNLQGAGTWRLDISDVVPGIQGQIDSWSLNFTAKACP